MTNTGNFSWTHESLAAHVHDPPLSVGHHNVVGWSKVLIYTRTSPTHYSLETGGQATYIKCHPKKKYVKLRFVHYIIFNTDTKLRWDYKYWIRLCGWTFGPSEWIRSIRILGTKYCNIVSRIWPPRSTASSCLLLFFFSFLFFWDRKPKKNRTLRGGGSPQARHIFLETRNCAIWFLPPIEKVIVNTCLL